jgi:hypothetical protein
LKVVFEVWKSDNNKTEIHFFDADRQNYYLFGINPKLFSKFDVGEMLAKATKMTHSEAGEIVYEAMK